MKDKIEIIKQKISFYFDDISTPFGKVVDIFVVFLIFCFSIIFVLKTLKFSEKTILILNNIEVLIVGLFIIEYFLRIWSAPDKIREIFKIYSIVDLIAIIPIFFMNDSYQILRVFRTLRILKLLRYMKGGHFFYHKLTQTHIIIIRIIFIISSIVFVSSGMIFYAEHNHPGANINTFFDAFYFSIITLTTVGYGDITPVTTYGRFITILIVISGIAFIPYQIKELFKQFLISEDKIYILCDECSNTYHDSDASYCKRCGAKISKKNIEL